MVRRFLETYPPLSFSDTLLHEAMREDDSCGRIDQCLLAQLVNGISKSLRMPGLEAVGQRKQTGKRRWLCRAVLQPRTTRTLSSKARHTAVQMFCPPNGKKVGSLFA